MESSPLSLLTNYKYYDVANENGTNVYKMYSDEISDRSILFKRVPIYEIVLAEIKAKYGRIMVAFDEYKKSMYKLGSEISREISALEGFSYSLIEDNEGLRFIKKQTNSNNGYKK